MLRTPSKPPVVGDLNLNAVPPAWPPSSLGNPQTPGLHTAAEGDFQRWYEFAERALEERLDKEARPSVVAAEDELQELSLLSQKLNSRNPKAITEVLQQLIETARGKQQHGLSVSAGLQREQSWNLRLAFEQMMPSVLRSPMPAGCSTHAAHGSPWAVVLFRARVVLSDVAIGMLLLVRERLYAHEIFWRWVELAPKVYASQKEARVVLGELVRLQKAVDTAAGLVHVSSADLAACAEDRDLNKLKTLIAGVTATNTKLFAALEEDGKAAIDAAAAFQWGGVAVGMHAPLLPTEVLLRSHRLLRTQCRGHPPPSLSPPSSAGSERWTATPPPSPAAHPPPDPSLAQSLLDELCLAQKVPVTLLRAADRLYRKYQLTQGALVACCVVSAAVFTLVFASSGRWAKLVAWGAQTRAAVRDFVANHVYEPVVEIYKELMVPMVNRPGRHEAEAAVEQGSLSLQRMLKDFITSVKPSAFRALRVVETGDVHNPIAWEPVVQVLEEQIQYPIFNAARGEVGRALLLEAIKTKVTIDQQAIEVDLLLRANRINLNALATIPAFLLIYFCTSVYRYFTRRFRRRLPTQNPAVKCIFCLREIHRLFTRLAETLPPEEISGERQMMLYLSWLEEHGRVLNTLSLLERSASAVTASIEIKRALAEDIEALKEMYAAKTIRLPEVDRIWHTYPWILTST